MPLPVPPSDPDGALPPARRPAQPFPRRAGSQAPFAGVESTLSPFAGPGGPAARHTPLPGPRRTTDLPPVHNALICVALPGLAISTDQGQLTGRGLEGFLSLIHI